MFRIRIQSAKQGQFVHIAAGFIYGGSICLLTATRAECEMEHDRPTLLQISELVGALSPVKNKGLHQGWTQTSLCLLVCHSTSHYTTSFFSPSNHSLNSMNNFGTQNQKNNNTCFGASLYSASTQHGNLHSAGWPILFCGPTKEPMLATANTRKSWERFTEKNPQMNGPEGYK